MAEPRRARGPLVSPHAAHERRGTHRGFMIAMKAALVIGALLVAFPLLWMFAGAFKTQREAIAFPPLFLPTEPTVDNFVRLFRDLNFGLYLTNTLIVVLISVLGLFAMALAGYGFAKFTFRAKGTIFFAVLATLMIPSQVTMIPSFLILHQLSLTNTLVGIALPTLVSGFGIFLFRQFMATIPDEILEAARIDGAGELHIFWRLVLPMSGPILAVQAILTFIGAWNSFLWPLIIASDARYYTISVGLQLLNQQVAVDPALQMAGATLMVVPVFIVFIIFQRYVVQGFALSGLK